MSSGPSLCALESQRQLVAREAKVLSRLEKARVED